MWTWRESNSRRSARILTALLDGGARAFDPAIHAYEQYCRGDSFLDNLALGFGLRFLDAADREALSDARKQQLAARSGSALAAETQRVIGWLDTGLVQPTGEHAVTKADQAIRRIRNEAAYRPVLWR